MLLEFVDVAKVHKGGLRGVDGVTMRPGAGLAGLLGPNGAGKSSLMRIAATVTQPTAGQVLFVGVDVVARPDLLRRSLGYLPQDFGVYPHLTAREFLSYLAAVKGMPARAARARIGELLELLDLASAGKRPLGKYSGRMLRRIGIAQALLADPRVLIVDEPTAGLDPSSGWRSGTCSPTWPATGCCCPRTSSPTSSRSPRTSRSWPAAGSCCAAARKICWRRPATGSGR